MAMKLAVVMDDIASINIKKDSTFAMLLEAQRRGYENYYLTQKDLFVSNGVAYGNMRSVQVQDDFDQWFELGEEKSTPLADCQIILMRKDPPFDMEYIYTTYMLELAEKAGSIVVNKPQSLRDANEKFATTWFPQCCVPTLVTRSPKQLKAFYAEHQDVIFKPLEGMGGSQVFHLKPNNSNTNVIIETLTDSGHHYIIAQRYIPEITQGDKRILIVNGEAIPYALARIPSDDDSRGNLARGATAKGIELSDRDRWICEQVGPTLKSMGLFFVGIDVIGDYLTEINITSPTCIRELDKLFDLNISAKLFDAIEALIK